METTYQSFWSYRCSVQVKKHALCLIYLKPLWFHTVALFKLSHVLPLNLVYFKTICLIMHNIFNNVMPPNVSNWFTYSSKIYHHNTCFSMASNFYLHYLWMDHLKNSFSSIGTNIWNSHYSQQWPCSAKMLILGHPTESATGYSDRREFFCCHAHFSLNI